MAHGVSPGQAGWKARASRRSGSARGPSAGGLCPGCCRRERSFRRPQTWESSWPEPCASSSVSGVSAASRPPGLRASRLGQVSAQPRGGTAPERLLEPRKARGPFALCAGQLTGKGPQSGSGDMDKSATGRRRGWLACDGQQPGGQGRSLGPREVEPLAREAKEVAGPGGVVSRRQQLAAAHGPRARGSTDVFRPTLFKALVAQSPLPDFPNSSAL